MSGIAERTVRHDFGRLPDLAARRAGGSVVGASDELFAAKENLIESGPPSFAAATFGHKGQIYDGWETRRRRSAGHDWAIIRLGLPGVVSGVVVDTAFFTGNYPPEISVEGCGVEGYPDPAELAAADWLSLVPRAAVAGDTANEFEVSVSCRVTHVRLRIYPDGGVARLRVHGRAVPDPRLLRGSLVNIAALANGAQVTGCSNMFYSSPSNLIWPGEARNMGEGWETARRRDDANDWVEIKLAVPGRIRLAELDTSYFVGNAPGWATLTGHLPGRPRRRAGWAAGRGRAPAAHPAAARHPAQVPDRGRRRSDRRPARRLPRWRHGPAAASGRADRGGPRTARTALVQPPAAGAGGRGAGRRGRCARDRSRCPPAELGHRAAARPAGPAGRVERMKSGPVVSSCETMAGLN